MPICRKRIAKSSGKPADEAPVQLLSTVPRTPDVITDGKTSLKQKGPVLDPRFEQHCTPAQLVRPDSSVMHVRLLRDTGVLQSLVCSGVLTDTDYTLTVEFRLIRGITGEVISVPLVEVTLSGSLCKGTFFCGLVSTLPEVIAVLVGNDICTAAPVADVSIVTRSQTAQARQSVSQNVAAPADTTPTSSVADQPTSTDRDDDNVTDLSPLFDEAAAQSPPSIDSVDRAELIRLQQADADLKNLFDLVDHEEQAELKAILTECADVFSDKPGKITLGVRHIELLPDTQPIRSAPYRLHPEKDEFLRKEFKNSAHISSVLSDRLVQEPKPF